MTPEEIAALQTANETLKAELEKLKKPPAPPKADDESDDDDDKDDDSTLHDRAKRGLEKENARKNQLAAIENAVRFNLGITDFVKTNKSILPEEVEEILKHSEKQTYDSVVEKSNAIKTSLIQSFFGVQSNLDLLTPTQNKALVDFLKLSASGKDAKAESVYENLLEPALQNRKAIKKAEELGKSRNGIRTSDSVQSAYKQRLIDGSRKFYLGESKGNQ